jgi:hypothetical protein
MSLKCAQVAFGLTLPFILSAGSAWAEDTIKIGVPVGLSGANSVVAPSVVQSAELAVDEINKAGGVLGRKMSLEVADDGSGAAGAQKAFDALIFQKKADVLITMETSAARNAGLPLVQRGKTPFIYTSFYEGRSCSPYLYVNAWVPEQQVPPIVDHFMKANNAKSFFLIGSDYAFGRGMLQFTRAYIEKHGGKVVGEEYLPYRLDADPLRAAFVRCRCADHLDGGRRSERDTDEAAAGRRREAALRQSCGGRRYRKEHGSRRGRHLHFRLIRDVDRYPGQQEVPRRHER